VILLGFKEAWTKWARLWRDRGFNVIAIDLRTYGPQGISPEIAANDVQDILLVIQQLHDIPAVMPDQIALAGGSIIGSYALVACAKSPDCRTAILLSATNYKGDLADPIETFGKRPLFIAVSDGEGSITETDRAYAAQAQGKHQLIVYEGTAHATGLLTSQPELADKIGDWLVKYLANTDATHGATVEF
jgi:pimeloyl-ACP methyl ester carboxylesterase